VDDQFGNYASNCYYSLKNPGSDPTPAAVTVNFYDPAGTPVATPVPHSIPAHAVVHVEVPDTFFPGGMGNIEFTAAPGSLLTGNIGSEALQRDEGTAILNWVPYFESQASPLIGTYITARNPSSSETVEVEVYYFDADGEAIAAQGGCRPASFELAPLESGIIALDNDEELTTGSVLLVSDGYVNGMVERFRLLDSLYPNDFDFEVSSLVPEE